jgi:hypothetical protein
MKRYATRMVIRAVQVPETVICDGCGIPDNLAGGLHEVVLSVSEGEEGGRRDELDLCDPCLVERAPALIAAGSRAPLVTGVYPDPEE